MKRFLALLLILVCIAGTAFADPWERVIFKYKVSAEIFGADDPAKGKELKLSLLTPDDTVCARFDGYDLMFTKNEDDTIRSISVVLTDESATWNFYLACAATINTLGEMSSRHFGQLFLQMILAKSGGENTPHPVGNDYFAVTKGDSTLLMFTYLNEEKEEYNY